MWKNVILSFQLPDPVQQDCDAERGRKAEDDFEVNEHREAEQLAYKEAAMPSFSLCDKKVAMPKPNRIKIVTKMARKLHEYTDATPFDTKGRESKLAEQKRVQVEWIHYRG